MAYKESQIKEILSHWRDELSYAERNGDAELARFAQAKIAYWNSKLKRKKSR